MDQLNQIITQRLKLINHYRSLPSETLLLNSETYADELIKQKRKESSREVLETRLLQAISSRRIDAPYRKEQFLRESEQLMKMYDPDFQFMIADDADVLASIVNLYVAFFNKQQCQRRAEQLVHIFKKGLCEKGMIIPTIMNWFIDWLRKTFRSFLKNILLKLTQNDKQKRQKKKNNRSSDVVEQVQGYRRSIEQISQKIEDNKKQEAISRSKSKLLMPEKQPLKTNSLHRKKSSLMYPDMSKNLKDSIEILQQYRTQQLKRSPSIFNANTKQLNKSPSISNFKKRQYEPNKQVYSGPVYNKQIVFSAFYEELAEYYRQFAGVLDIDNSFPKSLRRIDRRQQFKKKFGDISKSLAKNQTIIKKTNDNYLDQYENYCRREKQKKLKKIALEKAKINAEQNNQAKVNALTKKQLQLSERRLKKKVTKPIEQKYRVLKPSFYSKTIQIQLPAVEKSPRTGKISTINLKRERYQQQQYFQSQKSRGTIQIHRDMQQINSIFNRNSSHRVQSSARIVVQKFSSRKRYIDFDEKQQFDSHDKIFKFPRIGK